MSVHLLHALLCPPTAPSGHHPSSREFLESPGANGRALPGGRGFLSEGGWQQACGLCGGPDGGGERGAGPAATWAKDMTAFLFRSAHSPPPPGQAPAHGLPPLVPSHLPSIPREVVDRGSHPEFWLRNLMRWLVQCPVGSSDGAELGTAPQSQPREPAAFSITLGGLRASAQRRQIPPPPPSVSAILTSLGVARCPVLLAMRLHYFFHCL